MKRTLKMIWDMALPYQDKRDDRGHARIVTAYAVKLCAIESADDAIVIPAAILHDIGWSRLNSRERFLIFDGRQTPAAKLAVRLKHQKEGVKLAGKIMAKAGYPPDLISPILEIISEHDTRKGFLSPEDGAMRDADKLWRYSKTGMKADNIRNNYSFDFLYNMLQKQINEKNFFYFESAKKIAKEELKKRKLENS